MAVLRRPHYEHQCRHHKNYCWPESSNRRLRGQILLQTHFEYFMFGWWWMCSRQAKQCTACQAEYIYSCYIQSILILSEFEEMPANLVLMRGAVVQR